MELNSLLSKPNEADGQNRLAPRTSRQKQRRKTDEFLLNLENWQYLESSSANGISPRTMKD